jgi:hypothetical protein
MSKPVSKTDFILYMECAKNAWLRIHKPDVFYENELSEFAQALMETGNEVEIEARKLFPTGVLIDDRGEAGQDETKKLIENKTSVMFQPVFELDGFLAACDVLEYDEKTKGYIVTEIKATTKKKLDVHLPDIAFQVVLLRRAGLNITRANLMHLNPKYVRDGELVLPELFKIDDVTDEVNEMVSAIEVEMETAKKYLTAVEEPSGECPCVFRGKSRHCSTFAYNNPKVPEYSVHNIARIGLSKQKLTDLIDSGVYAIDDVSPDFDLTEIQRNQVDVHQSGEPMISKGDIAKELNTLVYPLYFLDYETYPAAIPRFDGFSPYNQIPFQFSLHILPTPDSELEHKEFIYTDAGDPSRDLAEALKEVIGTQGSVLVWNKSFELGRNEELAVRLPEFREMMDNIKERVYDLEDIFTHQLHVHPGFKGRTSIKFVLPTLAPELSYKDLDIQEGGQASSSWNEIVSPATPEAEKERLTEALKRYCELDTYAMYAIWKHLYGLINE